MHNIEYFTDIIIDGVRTNYEISNFGIVRNKITNKYIKSYIDKSNKRRYIAITVNGRRYAKTIARWLAIAFIPIPEGFDIKDLDADHIDGDPSNDILSNIQWLTKSENQLKRNTVDGKRNSGERNGMCKISEKQAISILKDIVSGFSTEEIHKRQNVHMSTITSIRCGQAWTHLSKDYDINSFTTKKPHYPKEIRNIIINYCINHPNDTPNIICKKLNLPKNKYRSLIKNIRKKYVLEKRSTTIENNDDMYVIDIKL